MRRLSVFIALSVVLGTSAFAANEKRRKPAEFQDVTEEDRAAARERSRNRMGTWREVDPIPESTFPWMQLGFVALTFAIAAPFAWGYYNRSSKELRDANAFVNQPRKRSSKAAEPADDQA